MLTMAELKAEIGQCLSWAEYANDFVSFEYYDSKICPLDSPWFTVTQVKALYNYCCYRSVSEDSLLAYVYPPQDNIALVWLDDDNIVGIGHNLLGAAQDFLTVLESWGETKTK